MRSKVLLQAGLKKIRFRWSYFRMRREFRFKGMHLHVDEGVLNPTLFTASKVFAKRVGEWLPAKSCAVLELGCGCGIASLMAAKLNHQVVALDIDSKAVANTEANAKRNQLTVAAWVSNWDEALEPSLRFDRIICNPPFLPGAGGSLAGALRAGSKSEKLKAVIAAVARRLKPGGRCLLMTSSQTNREAWLGVVDKYAQLQSNHLSSARHWQERLHFDELEMIQ